jgi:cytochrome bd ubiquinol oxidase subunit I
VTIEDLTRLQFAVTTLYHYLFVPLSISLALFTAVLQTVHLRHEARTGDDKYGRLSMLVGKLLMTTFAVGIVTGLVQEFQFGLGWSDFARFYGDVFGPTLAVEGMLAFFLEATFLGLWWFGRDRLPRLVHLATIWIVAIGTALSAFIILSANSFMQNPVGYVIDAETGRAELDSFFTLLTNELNLAAFPHTYAGSVMAGGGLVMAVGVWQMLRGGYHEDSREFAAYRTLSRFGAWFALAGGALVAISGDVLGKIITEVQPMKMAAAEALYETTTGAPFSIFSYAPPGTNEPTFAIEVPGFLSFLAKGDFTAQVLGLKDLQEQYTATYGPGDYIPDLPVAFWSFRLMIGVGMFTCFIALLHLWVTRKGRELQIDTTLAKSISWSIPTLPLMPLFANSFGWIFTETARQPWLAFGLFKTADGLSPGLSFAEVAASLVAFTVVYGVLAFVWVLLAIRLVRKGLPEMPVPAPDEDDTADDYAVSY